MAFAVVALTLTLVWLLQVLGVTLGCQFPMKWWGNWYQSGLGDIIITASHISSKGYCVEHHARSDFFVVENREENCHQCLLMIERHDNILQYKEGYCIGPGTMHSLCNNIRVEAVLYTLVREVSQPVPCPFQDAFEFLYNNNSGGTCRSSRSYARQCATNRKFHFRFNRCPDLAYTFDREVELECLATWKDRSELYLYGTFAPGAVTSKEDRYRCFMYSLLGSLVYLSMSADATCRGLRSSKDGPLTMELNSDVYNHWPTIAPCSLPSWLRNSSWRDLPGKYRLLAEEDRQDKLLLTNFRKNSVQEHVFSGYKCLRMHEETHASTMLTHVVEECQPRFQCIRTKRRHANVIQLQKGSYVANENHRCTESDFTTLRSNELFMAEDSFAGFCPFEGRYYSVMERTGCRLEMSAGCKNRSQLEVISTCQFRPVLQLRCLSWWRENQNLFFLAQNISRESSNRVLCFIMRQNGPTTEILQDKSCGQGVANLTSGQNDVYFFQNYLDECPLEIIQPEVAVINTIDDEKPLPEHGYSHVSSEDMSKAKELHVRSSDADKLYRRIRPFDLLLINYLQIQVAKFLSR